MIKKILKNSLYWYSQLLFKNNKSKVIFYHDIYDKKKYTDMGTPLDLFKKHLEVFKRNGFKLVDEIYESKGQLMMCFDDGFQGIFDVKDIFIENNIHPIVFLAVDLIGKEGYLNSEQIKVLQKNGFRFQCHGWSHKNLTVFSESDLVRELKESKDYLQELTGKSITDICFPIGFYSPLVLAKCDEFGYRRMFSSIPGNYSDNLGHINLRTRCLLQFSSPFQVSCILHGGLDLIRQRYIKMQYRN